MHKLLKRTDWPLLCGEATAFKEYDLCISKLWFIHAYDTDNAYLSRCTIVYMHRNIPMTYQHFQAILLCLSHNYTRNLSGTDRTVISYNSPVVFVKTLDKPLA